MTKHKRKTGTQTDIEDLILFAENDQAFKIAIDKINIESMQKPVKINLKELSIQLRDNEFNINLLKN